MAKDRFFKKPNGVIVKYNPNLHDLKSWKSRFEECSESGGKLKKKPKKK